MCQIHHFQSHVEVCEAVIKDRLYLFTDSSHDGHNIQSDHSLRSKEHHSISSSSNQMFICPRFFFFCFFWADMMHMVFVVQNDTCGNSRMDDVEICLTCGNLRGRGSSSGHFVMMSKCNHEPGSASGCVLKTSASGRSITHRALFPELAGRSLRRMFPL